MIKRFLAGILLAFGLAGAAAAAPVAICDLTGQHCVTPNADGSINTTGVAAATPTYPLLSSAGDGTGTATSAITGGGYQLALGGAFSGASVSVNVTLNGATTTYGPYTSTPTTPPCIPIGQGATAQAVVTGGSSPSISAQLAGVGSCASGGGGAGGAVQYNSSTGAATTVTSILGLPVSLPDVTYDGGYYAAAATIGGIAVTVPLDNSVGGRNGGFASMRWSFEGLTATPQQDQFVGSTNYVPCSGTITAITTGSTITPTGAYANDPNIASCQVSGPGITGAITIVGPTSATNAAYSLYSAVTTAEATAQTFTLSATWTPINASTANGLPVGSVVIQPGFGQDATYVLDVSGFQAVAMETLTGNFASFGYSYTLSTAPSPLQYTPDGALVSLGSKEDAPCGPAATTAPGCSANGRLSYIGTDLDKMLGGIFTAPVPALNEFMSAATGGAPTQVSPGANGLPTNDQGYGPQYAAPNASTPRIATEFAAVGGFAVDGAAPVAPSIHVGGIGSDGFKHPLQTMPGTGTTPEPIVNDMDGVADSGLGTATIASGANTASTNISTIGYSSVHFQITAGAGTTLVMQESADCATWPAASSFIGSGMGYNGSWGSMSALVSGSIFTAPVAGACVRFYAIGTVSTPYTIIYDLKRQFAQPDNIGVSGTVTANRTDGAVVTHTSVSSGAVVGTFTQVLALSTTRKDCTITNTGAVAEVIDIGASPSTSTAIPLPVGASFKCSSPGVVADDAISVAPTTAAAQTNAVWSY